jgi:hypothetical protein
VEFLILIDLNIYENHGFERNVINEIDDEVLLIEEFSVSDTFLEFKHCSNVHTFAELVQAKICASFFWIDLEIYIQISIS